jgi:sporulation protein YlmC with PRC-barrel domain
MLHRLSRLRGCHIHAVDGEIGHVDDVLVDERTFGVQYLVVDTSNWIGGRSVLVSTGVLGAVDSVRQQITVQLTREQIQASPSVDTADIALVETLPTIWIM